MIFVLLRIISLFRPVYRSMGVDFEQLKAIVGTKLLMDNRRNASAFGQAKKDESSYRFLVVVILYTLFGAFFGIAILFIPSLLVSATLYHAYLLVMISVTLISDFSSVLMDTSDNTIILPRPVSGKTLVAARNTHISLYLAQITLGLCLVPLIMITYKFGPLLGAALLITTTLTVLLSIMLTNGFYLLIMQFMSEEKLKTVINYFQIGVTIMIMGGYQIIPRLLGDRLEQISEYQLTWWSMLLPPFWMGGVIDLINSHNADLFHILSALLAVGVPVAAFFYMNSFLTKKFTAKLADLGTTINTTAEESEHVKSSHGGWKKWIMNGGLESAGFDLVTAIASRDRKLKLKIYPSIGYLFIMGFVFLYKGQGSLAIMINQLSAGSAYIFLLYAPFFVVQTVMAEIIFSDEFKAAWVYAALPISKPGEILAGSFKATIVKFFLPIYGVITILVLAIWKEKVIDDVVFAFGNNLFLFLATAAIATKHFPLSLEHTARNNAETFARTLGTMLMLVAVGFGHYFLAKVDYLLWVMTPIVFVIAWFMMKSYKNLSWNDMSL